MTPRINPGACGLISVITPTLIGTELATTEDPDALVGAADFVALADAELEDPHAANKVAAAKDKANNPPGLNTCRVHRSQRGHS